MKLRTVFWQQLRRPEIAAARDDGAVVLIPVGSTEQHGAHLAVDMDIRTATAVCARAAQSVDEFPVLVAPPVWSGYSPHHMENPGSITLRFDTFAAFLTDVVDSIRHHGFQHVVLINGHGGNIAHLTALANKLGTSGRPVAQTSWWSFVGTDFREILEGELKGVGHACEAETSCYLALDPTGVDLSAAVRYLADSHLVPIDTAAFEAAGVGFPSIFRAASPGIHGDPTLATAAKGERILTIAAHRLADFIRAYRATDLANAPTIFPDP
jgi:creatinine amidohydrolase